MTGGSTSSRTSSGASSTAGRPGMSARATPVSTSRMAGGISKSCRDQRNRRNDNQQNDQYLENFNHERTGARS